MKRLFAMLALIGLVFLGVACSGSPTTKGEVTVYVVVPLSGTQANSGQTVVGGARLMADQLNRKGGLLGAAVKVVALDDEGDDDTAKSQAETIAKAIHGGEKVIGVIGHLNSGQTAAGMEIYKSLPLVVITPTASEVSLTAQGYRNFFRVNANDNAQSPTLARFMTEQLKGQHIAVVYADNDYGKGLYSGVTKALQALGQTPAATVKIPEAQSTYASYIATIKSTNPDVVFLAGYETEGMILVPELRDAGLKVPFVCSDGCFNSTYVDEAEPASEGTFVGAITPDPKVVGDQAWWQDYRKVESRNPDTYSIPGYSAMAVLAAGIQKANTYDSVRVADTIRQLDLNTLVGHVTYDSNGDLKEQKVYVFQVKDAGFVQVFPKQ